MYEITHRSVGLRCIGRKHSFSRALGNIISSTFSIKFHHARLALNDCHKNIFAVCLSACFWLRFKLTTNFGFNYSWDTRENSSSSCVQCRRSEGRRKRGDRWNERTSAIQRACFYFAFFSFLKGSIAYVHCFLAYRTNCELHWILIICLHISFMSSMLKAMKSFLLHF